MLAEFLTLRAGLLRILSDFQLRRAAEAGQQMRAWLGQLGETWPTEEGPAEASHLLLLRPLVDSFALLCDWVDSVSDAAPDAQRFLQAAKARGTIAHGDLDGAPPRFAAAARTYLDALGQAGSIADVEALARLLAAVPVPLSGITYRPRRWSGGPPHASQPVEVSPVPVVKVLMQVDGQPWSNPQVVAAGVLYDLEARVLSSRWPPAAVSLRLDYLSTLPRDSYEVTEFAIERPADAESEVEQRGHVLFRVPQSPLAGPAVLRVRASFVLSDGSLQPTPVVGYHELSVRTVDSATVASLSQYGTLDAHVMALVQDARSGMPSVPEDHWRDFVVILSDLANFLGSAFQEALYTERDYQISEADFQRQLLRHLRNRHGEEVQEAPKRGGGPTDIVYRSITTELKVEKETSNVALLKTKHLGQVTQYSSGAGAQLGVVCILDLTEKVHPPGVPANYISIEDVPVHGFAEGERPPYPTKVAVVIVPGNLKVPSDYAR